MTDPKWKDAKRVFQEALDRTGPERARFVVEASKDDLMIRAQVEAWLAAYDEAGAFLGSPTVAGIDDAPQAAAGLAANRRDAPGTRIGPYRLLQVIGEGGFGIVYMAEQEHPIRRRVALKVLKMGMDTKEFIARFEAERQALAMMDHPNIAKVLGAGATESGRPYFVMELVKGVSITAYCDANRVSTRERLELFTEVCKAIHHAHEKGVVHRDLKPSNVMVTLHDGEPVPKIIDFGVAKATNQILTEKTLFTAYGEFIGTPAYMSPEQAELSGLEIDRRSDIYSLGVLLYELLTGTTPFEVEDLRSRALLEVLRIIREEDPPTPSTRLSTLGERLIDIAGRRQIEPDAIAKMLRGDLDGIVMKAIEKDRRRRYHSASEMADDLTRYFRHEPVIARPPSATYRLRKFARRRRGAVVGAAAIAAAFAVGGLGGSVFTPKPLSAPSKPHSAVSLVIADFENNTGDATFDPNILGQTIRRGVENASFISAYDRTRITGLGLPPPGRNLDETTAREFAVKHGFGVVLSGSIRQRGGGYEIDVKLTQTATGEVILGITESASNKSEVLEAATKLIVSVRQRLGDDTSESDQLFAMRSLLATSIEAMSQHAAGMEAQADRNHESARQSYLKAVGLDPKFSVAYLDLAVLSQYIGSPDDAEKYVTEALRYTDGMTERDHFAARAFYHRLKGDVQQCVNEYGELLARYPADVVALNSRAGCLFNLRNMRDAAAELQKALQLMPNHQAYRHNLAVIANYAGQFQAAEGHVRALQQPGSRSYMTLALSQLARGLVLEATETYRAMGTMDAWGASTAALGLGDLAVYEGRFSDAVRILEQGATADLDSKNPDRAAMKFASIAYAHLMAGNRDDARRAAERALGNSKSMTVRFLTARIFAEAGEIDKARALAATLASERGADSRAHGRIIEGQANLKGGNVRDAITILGEANALVNTWVGHFDLGRAYLSASAFREAASEFAQCVARRGEALSLMGEGPTYGQFPVAYYYQGVAREGLKTVDRRDSYREYLKIRGRSTEDPLVPEIRKRAGG